MVIKRGYVKEFLRDAGWAPEEGEGQKKIVGPKLYNCVSVER